MHLLIIFDPRTEPLVHHFLKLDRTAEVSADWILYVLARATWAIRERYAGIRAPQDSVSIAMPDMKDTPYAESYAEAATRHSHGRADRSWLERHETYLNLQDGNVEAAAPGTAGPNSTSRRPRLLHHYTPTFPPARCSRAPPRYSLLSPKPSAPPPEQPCPCLALLGSICRTARPHPHAAREAFREWPALSAG